MVRDKRWGVSELPSTCGPPASTADNLAIDFNAVYETIIADAISRVHELHPDVCISCKRGQDIPESGDIRRQVIEQICKADLTITDITSNNPNVLLEYGIRLSVKDSGNILVCHESAQESIPFNIGHLRTIPYSIGLNSIAARNKIVQFLNSYLNGERHPERSLYYEYVELYAGRLLEKRMMPLARAAPALMAQLAEKVFADDESGRDYKELVFDYLTKYKDALAVDPQDQREVIEHLKLVSRIKGLGPGRLRHTLYEMAKICNADPERKEEGARFLEEAKRLED
jgi:hypothetical protein